MEGGVWVEFLQPPSLHEALETKAEYPEAVPISGGTDLMVEINFDRGRPETVLDLSRVPELAEWSPENGHVRVGAGVTYERIIAELGESLPGLAMASRTVGSPQIRNRGTVGGNLGTSSPAGDALPSLYASKAEVELSSTAGTRLVPVSEFVTGPKRNVLRPDELISIFASKAGQLAGNHFLTVTEGRENLRALGEKTPWEGAQDILFERASWGVDRNG